MVRGRAKLWVISHLGKQRSTFPPNASYVIVTVSPLIRDMFSASQFLSSAKFSGKFAPH
jgi:hypothetical protein